MSMRALLVTILLAELVPATGVAQVQTYYRVGAWDAFSGRNENGGAVCGMGNTSNGRRLAIRFEIGGAETNFSASKPDWSIPDNTRVSLVMQVGLNTPWARQAAGHEHAIDWALDGAGMQAFDRQFRGSSSMTLTFPDGSEPPWAISLAGSTAISDTFARCVRDLTRQVRSAPPGPSDPTVPQGPTQPFSSAPPPR